MYLVSACLVGIDCKYNGKNNHDEKLIEFIKNNECVYICPEQLGGLSTPRLPAEIVGVREGRKIVKNNEGIDVTNEFYKGAYESLKIARLYDINAAILKARSPSCGYNKIYDGSFSGKLVQGKGITSEILEQNGIKIYTEEDIKKLIHRNK